MAELVPAPSVPARVAQFWRDMVAEMKKVAWPDRPQVQSLAIGVIALSLFIGLVIALMDLLFQQVLVRWLPTLFAR